jgi:hypothetical protein
MDCVSCEVWIYVCYVEERRPPLWSSVQSSWLQIQRAGFDSRRYHIFWEAVGLERGPLSLVSTTEELLERESSGSGLERREYGRRDPSRWPLALTSPTNSGRHLIWFREGGKPPYLPKFWITTPDTVMCIYIWLWHCEIHLQVASFLCSCCRPWVQWPNCPRYSTALNMNSFTFKQYSGFLGLSFLRRLFPK